MRGAAGGVLLYRRHRPFAGFINRDSITEGRSWWGYIDRRGERFNPVVDVEAEGPEN